MTKISKRLGMPALTKTKGLLLASIAASAVAFSFFASPTVKANNEEGENSDRADDAAGLSGTWIVQVSLDPATVPPNTPFLNFTSLETFNLRGGYLESNNGPAAGGPGGQGNWARTGHREYAVTELRLGFNPAHAFTGIDKIRRSLTLNQTGDEFTGTVQVDIFLPNGTQVPVHPAGTFHGTRVPIEPLN